MPATAASINPNTHGTRRSAHAGHGKPGGTDATDCTCGDSTGCECACVLALYPPTTVALFAGSYPPVPFDVPLPVLQ